MLLTILVPEYEPQFPKLNIRSREVTCHGLFFLSLHFIRAAGKYPATRRAIPLVGTSTVSSVVSVLRGSLRVCRSCLAGRSRIWLHVNWHNLNRTITLKPTAYKLPSRKASYQPPRISCVCNLSFWPRTKTTPPWGQHERRYCRGDLSGNKTEEERP